MPIISVNAITLAILGTGAGSDAGKLAASVTGTFGSSGLGQPVMSLSSVLKPGGDNTPRPSLDVRVIYDLFGPGTADNRLRLYINGSLHDSEAAVLSTAVYSGGRLDVFGFGNGGSALTGVLLNNFVIHQGTPATGAVPGIPEPTGILLAATGAVILTQRRRRAA